MKIDSPLAAIGGVIVLIQAISAGALFGVRDQETLQWILVTVIALVTVIFTSLIVWLIRYLALNYPALLFSPRDINPAIHGAIYPKQPEKILTTLEDKPDKVPSGDSP